MSSVEGENEPEWVCEECKETVKKDAMACQHCGHRTKDNEYGAGYWIITILMIWNPIGWIMAIAAMRRKNQSQFGSIAEKVGSTKEATDDLEGASFSERVEAVKQEREG